MKQHYSIFCFCLCTFLFQCFESTDNINSVPVYERSSTLIHAGNEKIRDLRYREARIFYEQAIEIDSSRSDAYYGYLTAVRLEKKLIDGFQLFINSDINSIISELDLTKLTIINNFYKGSTDIRRTLAPFILRDSLTDLYKKSLTFNNNPLITTEQYNFINNYLSVAETDSTLYQLPLLNLVDGFRDRFNIGSDFTIINYMYYFTAYRDTDTNSIIDSNDRLSLIRSINSSISQGLVNNDLRNIVVQLRTLFHTSEIDDRVLLYKIFLMLSETERITDLLKKNTQASTIQPVLDTILGHLNYFFFEDGRDNDGDGCVDEEAFDGFDNDGDGIIDEDTRVNGYEEAPFDLAEFFAPGADSMNSEVLIVARRPNFTLSNNFFQSEADIKNSNNNLKFRDSILTLIRDSTPPYNLTTEQLEYAKNRIGGCWSLFY